MQRISWGLSPGNWPKTPAFRVKCSNLLVSASVILANHPELYRRSMSKKKLFNDPVYGFVSVPYGILFRLVEHPYFQRLRRIKQVSLTHYVYPGALHTRFHHAMGAMHLTQQAIHVLRTKGVEISEEESTGVLAAILLHDIGHGPFSHTLEHTLMEVHHEELSIWFMEKLNEEFDGELDLALKIFKDEYPKKFLHQLVSSQLDMDRLDYLNRDSFFTGVHEGVVGYHRLIQMLAVHDNKLVIEQKGILSIEKFLLARRMMYWQVYLHKTVLSAEQMLIRALRRAKELANDGLDIRVPKSLAFFLNHEIRREDFVVNRDLLLDHFAKLDDFDIVSALKSFQDASDPVLAFLSGCILDRRLFRLTLQNEPFREDEIRAVEEMVLEKYPFGREDLPFLVFTGEETNAAYSTSKAEINILLKNGAVKPMSEVSDYEVQSKLITKYYLCYPKSPAQTLYGQVLLPIP